MLIFPYEVIKNRRQRLSNALETSLPENSGILICCGEPLTRPGGLDQTYDFLPDPDYFWISGLRRPAGVAFYSKQTGWKDFVAPISSAEIIWEGATGDIPTHCQSLEELSSFLKKLGLKSFLLYGQNTLQNLALPLENSGKTWFEVRTHLHQTRRVKDAAEIELIRQAAKIAHKGYKRVVEFLKAGVTERQIQVEYEAEVQRQGAHKMPYDTIVGTGNRSAVLHAIPTERKVLREEMVLIDAGVDLYDYCVDITRVYPVSGQFSTQQENLYSIVLDAQRKAIATAKPGVEWRQVHFESARIIAEGLKNLNILKGQTDSILETGAISTFYPHGVGHLVGLRVRDTGCLENLQPQKICGVTLRVDMKIQEGQILTAEPGCYFVEALLQSPEVQNKYKDFINWPEVERWKSIGGIRIEDDILITQLEPENLTAVVEK